jgi:hypothetical protein
MSEPLNPAGDYLVYLLEEMDILTNCIKALAEYRKHVGEYWPSRIIINRNNRLTFGFGEGIKIRRGSAYDTWIINNAIYMSTDNPLRDPAHQRKATALQTGTRQPIEDVYEQVYRIRTATQYVMTLPTVGEQR